MPYEWIILSFSSCAHYWCSLTANMCHALIRIDFMRLDFDTNVSCNKCVSHLASFFFLAVFLSLQNLKAEQMFNLTWHCFDQIFNMNHDVNDFKLTLKMRSRNWPGVGPNDKYWCTHVTLVIFSDLTGSTLSVRTSPTHGKDGSSSPLPIPLQRSAVINNSMLPRNSQASHRNNDNEACIQVANIESDPSSSPDKEYEICSSKNLCGPNPKKVTVIVALILSIWASFILGVNIHKKVSLLF